jgi:hypothetical protein
VNQEFVGMRLAAIRGINEIIYFSGRIKSLPLRVISRVIRSAVPLHQHHRLPRRIQDPWSASFQGARRYVRSDLSLEKLFITLKERGISYVVMRWFEDLPEIEEGEDIDFLIADRDLPRIVDLFTYQDNGGQKCDIYSVSGLQGSNLNDMPYYPPHLSQQLLDTRIWHKDIFAVPDRWHHFLSLAYHAVFHKGENSGLPNENHAADKCVNDHDYQFILKNLASALPAVSIDFEFNQIFLFLKSQEWVPELDTLRRLAIKDKWLWDLLPAESKLPHSGKGETLLFVVRDWAISNNKLESIKEMIESSGLVILRSVLLTEKEKKIATQKIRGGKWDNGPFPVSGGLPGCFIICFDPNPAPPKACDSKDHPFVKNRNVFLKNTIRDKINQEMLCFSHVNCIHSSDDEYEVWEHIKQVLPSEFDPLHEEVAQLRSYSVEPVTLTSVANPSNEI